MKKDELIDSVLGMRSKKWYQYGLGFYWIYIKRGILFCLNRPLCFLNWHGPFDGCFMDGDGTKRYVCRYCDYEKAS